MPWRSSMRPIAANMAGSALRGTETSSMSTVPCASSAGWNGATDREQPLALLGVGRELGLAPEREDGRERLLGLGGRPVAVGADEQLRAAPAEVEPEVGADDLERPRVEQLHHRRVDAARHDQGRGAGGILDRGERRADRRDLAARPRPQPGRSPRR